VTFAYRATSAPDGITTRNATIQSPRMHEAGEPAARTRRCPCLPSGGRGRIRLGRSVRRPRRIYRVRVFTRLGSRDRRRERQGTREEERRVVGRRSAHQVELGPPGPVMDRDVRVRVCRLGRRAAECQMTSCIRLYAARWGLRDWRPTKRLHGKVRNRPLSKISRAHSRAYILTGGADAICRSSSSTDARTRACIKDPPKKKKHGELGAFFEPKKGGEERDVPRAQR
jgi:hypothetical protein